MPYARGWPRSTTFRRKNSIPVPLRKLILRYARLRLRRSCRQDKAFGEVFHESNEHLPESFRLSGRFLFFATFPALERNINMEMHLGGKK